MTMRSTNTTWEKKLLPFRNNDIGKMDGYFSTSQLCKELQYKSLKMSTSLFWKMLHQLMKKMVLAGSTGTLKQMPKAILQSCCKFPSAQCDYSSYFRQLWVLSHLSEHWRKCRRRIHKQLLTFVASASKKNFFSIQGINFSNTRVNTKWHLAY